jgi:hypothetical protein
VGVRKVLCSSRLQLLRGNGRNHPIAITAIALAILITFYACLYQTSCFYKRAIKFAQPQTILFLLSLLVVVTLFAGIYPALILSGFKAALVKNKITSDRRWYLAQKGW